MRATTFTFLAVAGALLSLTTVASAGPPRAAVLGAGHSPGIAVDGAGVAHLAFASEVPGSGTGEETIAYCRMVPAGAPSCAPRNILIDGGSTGPTYVTPIKAGAAGGPIALASCRVNRDGDLGEVIAVSVLSADGGRSFSGPIDLGHKTACGDGAFSSDGTVALAGSLVNTTVMIAGIAGPPVTEIAAVLPGGLMDATVDYYGRRPVVVSTRIRGTQRSSTWSGAGDPNDGATWSQPSRTIGRYDHIDLDAGSRGLFLIGQKQFGKKVAVHRFDGTRFGRGRVLMSRRNLALGGHPAIAQDGRGRVLALWQERDKRALWASASRDGRRWSTPIQVARRASYRPGKLEVALDPSGRGMAVWSDDNERLLAVRLNLGRILRGRR